MSGNIGVKSLIGADWAKTEENIKTPGYVFVDSGTTTSSDTNSSALIVLKGGAILNNSHRLSLSYQPSFNSDSNTHNFFAGYDYLIPVNNENRFYLGAHAGISSFKGKDKISDYDMSGFAYGAQVGYIYDITKNIEFELGLMYTKYNLDTDGNRQATNGSTFKSNLELKHSIGTMIGINYKF